MEPLYERERGVGKDGDGCIPYRVRVSKSDPYKGWLRFQRRGRAETVEVSLAAVSSGAGR